MLTPKAPRKRGNTQEGTRQMNALDTYIELEATMTPAAYSAWCKQVGVIQEMRLRTTHKGDLDGAFAAAVADCIPA